VIYLDTGFLVKLYYPEPESAKVAALVQGKSIWHTPLHELEFTNALAMKVFFKTATEWTEGDVANAINLTAIHNSALLHELQY
jgi:predicted nucleic acid-binding protein